MGRWGGRAGVAALLVAGAVLMVGPNRLLRWSVEGALARLPDGLSGRVATVAYDPWQNRLELGDLEIDRAGTRLAHADSVALSQPRLSLLLPYGAPTGRLAARATVEHLTVVPAADERVAAVELVALDPAVGTTWGAWSASSATLSGCSWSTLDHHLQAAGLSLGDVAAGRAAAVRASGVRLRVGIAEIALDDLSGVGVGLSPELAWAADRLVLNHVRRTALDPRTATWSGSVDRLELERLALPPLGSADGLAALLLTASVGRIDATGATGARATARLSIGQLQVMDAAGGRVGRATLDRLAWTDDGAVDGDGSLRGLQLERTELDMLDLAAVRPGGRLDATARAGVPIGLDHAHLAGLQATPAGRPVLSVATLDLGRLALAGMVVTRLDLRIAGLLMPSGLLPGEADRLLGRLEQPKLGIDAELAYRFEPVGGRLAIERLGLGLAGLGRLDLSAELAGVPAVPVMAASWPPSWPPSWDPEALSGIDLVGATADYVDGSLARRLLSVVATDRRQTDDAARTALLNQLAQAAVGAPLPVVQLLGSAADFLRRPAALHVVAKPAERVALLIILALALSAPDQLVPALSLTAEAR